MMDWIAEQVRTLVPMPFFFSSRRRHTRCLSDWSSDVCSSDLPQPRTAGVLYVTATPCSLSRCGRSEERRVGKECGRRGAPQELKKTSLTAAADGSSVERPQGRRPPVDGMRTTDDAPDSGRLIV